MALWWVPEGHRPTVAEAKERLALFDRGPENAVATDDRWACPTGWARTARQRSDVPAPSRRSRPPRRAMIVSAVRLSRVKTTDTAAMVGVKP